MYDVIIIGAGVTGSAIARELSRYQLEIAVLEREEDVCCGTSKANSGIVHAGFDAFPGSWKAQMNVRGNHMMEELSEKLDFPFRRNGSLVLCFEEQGRERLNALLEQGKQNGVKGLRILEREELLEMEPALSTQVVCALFAPSGGIVCPFKLTIAMAENAADNGVSFLFQKAVTGIEKTESGYRVKTKDEEYCAHVVVNAAGVYADVLHNQVSSQKLQITARKGEYCLLDKKTGNLVSHTIFQLPTQMGKGVLVTPTVHGNLLLGPTAEDMKDKEGIDTTAAGMNKVLQDAGKSIAAVPRAQIINSFAGLRAHEAGDDFVLGEVQDAPGFFDAAGIESPGLTSAPAIGVWMAEQIADCLKRQKEVKQKEDFCDSRTDIFEMAKASPEKAAEMIAKNPAYGNVICRCETITEGEILDAIHRTLGARDMDGIKRRTRAGMGRCQSGFCSTRVMEILCRELRMNPEEVTKTGGDSRMITGGVRS